MQYALFYPIWLASFCVNVTRLLEFCMDDCSYFAHCCCRAPFEGTHPPTCDLLPHFKYLANQFVTLAKHKANYPLCWKSMLKAKHVHLHGRNVVAELYG